MTKLEAVNSVLTRLGRNPVAALNTDGPSEAGKVERVIDDVERQVQYETWDYNTRKEVSIAPAAITGYVAIPNGCISFDCDRTDRNIIQRGDYAYDLDRNTDVFTETLTYSYTLRMTWCSIPPVIREYIVAEAARQYAEHNTLKDHIGRLTNQAELARLRAIRDDTEGNEANVFNTAEHQAIRGYRRG